MYIIRSGYTNNYILIVQLRDIDLIRMTNPIINAGCSSLTGTMVRGLSCQNTRRGRGEYANTSKATAYTSVASGP